MPARVFHSPVGGRQRPPIFIEQSMSNVTDNWLASILMSPRPTPTPFDSPSAGSQSQAEPTPYLLPEQEPAPHVRRLAEALVRGQGRSERPQPIDEALAAQQARDAWALRTRRGVLPPGGRPDGPLMEFTKNMFIPQGPSDVALYLLGGPFRPALKAAALGLGAALEPSPAQAGAGKIIRGAGNLGERLIGRFPQYAERYPEVGNRVQKTDPTTGKDYWAKELTPEAKEFSTARFFVDQDMRRSGYEPHFDPNKRTHVDPTFYPPNANTFDIIPTRKATFDKHMQFIGSDEARSRLKLAYERGLAMVNARDWFAMGQLEDAFIREHGSAAGRRAFQDRFATSMASTTAGSNPAQNLITAHYGNFLQSNRLPYPRASYEMPFPVGGQFATPNMTMHQRLSDGGSYSALSTQNPKRLDYGLGFLGHPEVMPVDSRITRGMTPGLLAPRHGTYGLYGRVLREEAAEARALPRDYRDVVWAGFGPEHSVKPMISYVNDAIERTHRLTGVPRDEIVRRGLIRGQIPLYGLGGLVSVPVLQSGSIDQTSIR
jgi:hypothetical protein